MLSSKFSFKQPPASSAITKLQSSALSSNQTQQIEGATYVIAKYDYQSQGPQELTIKKGDKLLLVDDSRHWWKVLNSEESIGFVPSNYVKKEKHSIFGSIKRNIRVTTKSKKPSLSTLVNPKTSPSSSPLISKQIENVVINNQTPNHLAVRPLPGLVLTSSSQLITNRKQPQSHSDILVQELGPNFNGFCQSSTNNNNNNNNVNSSDQSFKADRLGKVVTAYIRYTYKSQQQDELSLVKGSMVKVMEKSDDGWWKGELDGAVGWFPSNYVIEEEKNDSNDNASSSAPNDTMTPTIATQKEQTDKEQDTYDEVLFVVVALYSFPISE